MKVSSRSSLRAPASGFWRVLFLAVAAAGTLACITINVYFPEAAVKDLSEKIEEAVAEEAAKAAENASEAPEIQASDTQARLGVSAEPDLLVRLRATALPLLLALTADPVAAQTVAAPEITNPAIRKIIESRGQRLPQLQPFKASGVLGENNQALLEIRELGSLALQDRARVQKLVKDENADRERMFKEIAAATGADLSQLPKVRATYATTLRNQAERGEWIQMPDGSWKQK